MVGWKRDNFNMVVWKHGHVLTWSAGNVVNVDMIGWKHGKGLKSSGGKIITCGHVLVKTRSSVHMVEIIYMVKLFKMVIIYY